MIPILFEYNATTGFATHGIGDLIDAMECFVEVNDEGEYELAMKYPVNGHLFSELKINRLILAKVPVYKPPADAITGVESVSERQLFRIYGHERNIDGTMSIMAQHITYDLSNVIIKNFVDYKAPGESSASAINRAAKAISAANANIGYQGPLTFNVKTNVTASPNNQEGKFTHEEPGSYRALILDGDNSIAGTFGGDLVFDNRTVLLYTQGGKNRGIRIRYGVDLMDLSQEKNISEMVTGVLPYFKYTNPDKNVGGDLYLYGDVLTATNIPAASDTAGVVHRIQPLDVTEYLPNNSATNLPSGASINAQGRKWMQIEKIGQPEINLTLKYAQLGQEVYMHDQITVIFDQLGISTSAKVTKIKYDVLRERVDEIEVGKAKPSALFKLSDASRLKRGYLPPERIAAQSISGGGGGGGGGGGSKKKGQIKDGSVGEDELGDKAVTNPKIDDKAVDTPQLEDEAVETDKIDDKAVTEEKLSLAVQNLLADVARIKELSTQVIHNDGSIWTTSVNTLNVSTQQINSLNIGWRSVLADDGESIVTALCAV